MCTTDRKLTGYRVLVHACEHNTKYIPSGEKRQSCEVCLNASEKFMCIARIILFDKIQLFKFVYRAYIKTRPHTPRAKIIYKHE